MKTLKQRVKTKLHGLKIKRGKVAGSYHRIQNQPRRQGKTRSLEIWGAKLRNIDEKIELLEEILLIKPKEQ